MAFKKHFFLYLRISHQFLYLVVQIQIYVKCEDHEEDNVQILHHPVAGVELIVEGELDRQEGQDNEQADLY